MGRTWKSVERKCDQSVSTCWKACDACGQTSEECSMCKCTIDPACMQPEFQSVRCMGVSSENCTHVSAHCMQHASRSCTTSFLFGPSTHTMIKCTIDPACMQPEFQSVRCMGVSSENCTHVSAHCMQHASRSCTTSFLFGPSTHTMIREACSARGVPRATTLARRPWRLPEVRCSDVSGPPASRSDTRRRSFTLPEVRCSDVSGPPASRSYTRWPGSSTLPEVRWSERGV